MRHIAALIVATLLMAGCDAGKRSQAAGALEPVPAQTGDSVFQAMNVRHGQAVGEDPMTLAHQFETTEQGGTSFSSARCTTKWASLRFAPISS